MHTLQETIRPSADLRNHYSEISKQCRENNEAVIITVKGRGDTVSLGYGEYQRMKSRIELLELLAEAQDDIDNEMCIRDSTYPALNFVQIQLRPPRKNLPTARRIPCLLYTSRCV